METIASSRETPILERRIFTVGELTYVIKDLLEEAFPFVWVEGEVANLRSPNSGHLYFTLRDEVASLRAVLFRSQRAAIKFDLEDGLHVLCFGRISVYEPRGEYQLIVQLIEPRGLGALQLALEQLKRRLANAGFFDTARKRPLPLLPRAVGVVTSLSGAALRDFLKVALSRFHRARIVIFPVWVQGEGAAEEIAEGVRLLSRHGGVELIVVTRGGGSLEDLWAFNEEVVAKAVFDSSVPVVSAVGHEIDYTICDLVADARAPTPTAAAQMVFPAEEELYESIRALEMRLLGALREILVLRRKRLEELSRRLKDPRASLVEAKERLRQLRGRLQNAWQNLSERKRQRLSSLTRHLEAVSPLSVLSRGYSLVKKLPEGTLLKDASALSPGDRVEILFYRGRVRAKVEEVESGE